MVQKLAESKLYRNVNSLLVTLNCKLRVTQPGSTEHTKAQQELDTWSLIPHRLTFLRQNLARAASRGEYSKEINIKLDDVYEVGEQQEWKCAFTGIPLEFERGGTNWGGKWCNPNSCTIDRIDSSKGYVKGNIQLVTWKVNCIKRDLHDDEFIEICKLVAKTR